MATQIVYVVVHVNWEYNDGWFYPDGDTPVKGFADIELAEKHREEMERTAHLDILAEQWSEEGGTFPWWSENLFTTFGQLPEISSHTEEEILQLINKSGLPQPPMCDPDDQLPQPGYKYRWWDGNWWSSLWQHADAAGSAEFVWHIFDKIRFYEVVAVEVQ